jgi:hypothetical protein
MVIVQLNCNREASNHKFFTPGSDYSCVDMESRAATCPPTPVTGVQLRSYRQKNKNVFRD